MNTTVWRDEITSGDFFKLNISLIIKVRFEVQFDRHTLTRETLATTYVKTIAVWFMLYITTCLACCKICIRKVTNPCCGALHESSDEQSQQDLPWYLKILEKQARDHHNWLQ